MLNLKVVLFIISASFWICSSKVVSDCKPFEHNKGEWFTDVDKNVSYWKNETFSIKFTKDDEDDKV